MDRDAMIALEKEIRSQEETIRFDHFSNRDALALGRFLTDRIYDQGMALALCIRRVNGAILYQHMTEGTCLNNQQWMMRKFNTVCHMERSSYGAWAKSNITGETASAHGLSDAAYVFCGGGFPITLKTGEIVAVATVSNLPHAQDHQFLVDGLRDWLNQQSPTS